MCRWRSLIIIFGCYENRCFMWWILTVCNDNLQYIGIFQMWITPISIHHFIQRTGHVCLNLINFNLDLIYIPNCAIVLGNPGFKFILKWHTVHWSSCMSKIFLCILLAKFRYPKLNPVLEYFQTKMAYLIPYKYWVISSSSELKEEISTERHTEAYWNQFVCPPNDIKCKIILLDL